jgi:asparagine synthase (glutamine-hydrolysing)
LIADTGAGKGDFILVTGAIGDPAALAARLSAAGLWQRGGMRYQSRVLHCAPGLVVLASGIVTSGGDAACGVAGQVDSPAAGGLKVPVPEPWVSAWAAGARPDPLQLSGSYALAGWSRDGGVFACTDLFRSCPLYVRQLPGGAVAVGTDLRLLAACTEERPRLNLQAVYHLLNLYYVPTPLTMYQGIVKVPPATWLRLRNGRQEEWRYWMPRYPETVGIDAADAALTLRATMERAVQRQRPQAGLSWGTFLSGGTDSSSIAGMLARATATGAAPVRSFSIGFDEQGFDELGYCDFVAHYYGLEAHTERVSATDTLALLPDIISAYDEPAGNASSIPTMACARLARRQGIDLLIGGDGGDEIFGGNERYRKDAIMQRFFLLPAPLRAIARGVAGTARVDMRLLNRVRNFVRRASLPNPDRFYTDDAFASEWFDALLTPDFRAAVARESSLDALRAVYARADAPSELHKLMFLDLELTIADNDIVKVTRAARANGVAVRFPYLDRELVEYTGTLAADLKVRGGEKRYLFRRAVRDLLPPEVLRKKKQGFGLPVGVWFRTEPRYRELLHDVVCGAGARLRPLIDSACVSQLLARHESGAWDHGAELWVLLILEQWLQREGVRP